MIKSTKSSPSQLDPSLDTDSVIPLVREGILYLLDALELARDVESSEWDFALEISSLQQLGIQTSQLRWLVRKELAEHARETTGEGADERTFERVGSISFGSTSCFVLTDRGEQLAKTCRGDAVELSPSVKSNNGVPVWDSLLRELRYESQVVKRYRVPSPNQQMVLGAFEEEGWPCCVYDPLPPHPEVDPKRRLHDTIKSLNRHQISPLLRFYGDGTGEGVRWGSVD